jgi:hypothetical protein
MTMARIQIDDPDLPLSRLLARWPQTLRVFMAHRMDEAAFRAELRAAVSAKQPQAAC